MTAPYRWPDPLTAPVLRLSGELDLLASIGVSTEIRDFAAAHPSSVLIIDLAEVSFMDSSGLDPLC